MKSTSTSTDLKTLNFPSSVVPEQDAHQAAEYFPPRTKLATTFFKIYFLQYSFHFTTALK